MPINGSTYKRRSRRVAGLAGSVWAIPLLALATPAIAQVADRVVRLRSGQIVEVRANPHPLPPEEVVW